MPRPRHHRLLVEGDEDKRVIPELIEANGIPWGERRREAIVDIKSYDGIENLLDRKVIATELKASGLVALGILADANDDAAKRWRRLRQACLPSVPDMPEELPEEGLVYVCESGIKLGVWIMPDNRMRGMLETFLALLVPAELKPVWEWTEALCDEAHRKGARFRTPHRDKARIHAWLAFQDPPGRPLHNAVIEKVLDPTSPNAEPFVGWFRRLYGLERRA